MDTKNKEASRLINSLTINEDLRQDLWVAYLSGTPIANLSQKIIENLISYDIQSKEAAAYELAISNIPQEISDLFNSFEKHTMFLLYMGYNIGEISVTLGKSRVAILGLISSIKQNNAWDKLKWRLKDRSQMMKNSD